MARIITAVAFIAVLSAAAFGAEKSKDPFTPGQVTTITCKADAKQTYACYVPKKYDKSRKWNILYCFSPNGDGMLILKLFTTICEEHGWIVAGSNNAKNGPGAAIGAAIEAIWKDTHERFNIRENGCYAGGFSGGSGMSFGMAEEYPDNFAGVIPMAVASTWADATPDIPKHISVYFIIGNQDGGITCVNKHADALKARGNKVEINVFNGKHEPPPADSAVAAVKWLLKIEVDLRTTEKFAEAEKLLADKWTLEARDIFAQIQKDYPDEEVGKKAAEKIKAIDSDEKLADELKAGKIYATAAGYEKKGKKGNAFNVYRNVVLKFPNTEYAKRAREKCREIDPSKPLDEPPKPSKDGEKEKEPPKDPQKK
jgi:hypothetical protein